MLVPSWLFSFGVGVTVVSPAGADAAVSDTDTVVREAGSLPDGKRTADGPLLLPPDSLKPDSVPLKPYTILPDTTAEETDTRHCRPS